MNHQLTGYPSIDKPWLKYFSEEAINRALPECTIYDYLYNNNKNNKDSVAIEYFGRKITYKKLFNKIQETAKAFVAIGVKKDDIVIVSTITTPETVYIIYALNYIGAIPNMVDLRTGVEGIKEYIEEVEAKYVVALDMAYEKMLEAIKGTDVEKMILLSATSSMPFVKRTAVKFISRNNMNPEPGSKIIKWDLFLKQGSGMDINKAIYEKDKCCVIVHTGGTTGNPKGVMLSNDNVNASAWQSHNSPILMKKEDKFLNILPPFVAYGFVLGIHTAVSAGWHSIIIPKFDVEKFDSLIMNYKPAGIMGVPTYYEKIMDSKLLVNKDLSFLKVVLVGGDKTSAEFEHKVNAFFREHNSSITLSKGYSMTEASSTATISFEIANKDNSNGVPLSKTIVSAFDPDTGKEVPVNQEGELCINTPTMMLGYYGKTDETNKIIKTHSDGSVWIHTGDIGRVDEEGFVFVNGRIKRLIIRYDGYKVFPVFIEDVVMQHSDIDNCCAIGKIDKEHIQGKLPYVYVVCKNKDIDEDKLKQELYELCKAELPEYAMPIGFSICDSLPVTNIGKIDYRKLEDMANKE